MHGEDRGLAKPTVKTKMPERLQRRQGELRPVATKLKAQRGEGGKEGGDGGKEEELKGRMVLLLIGEGEDWARRTSGRIRGGANMGERGGMGRHGRHGWVRAWHEHTTGMGEGMGERRESRAWPALCSMGARQDGQDD